MAREVRREGNAISEEERTLSRETWGLTLSLTSSKEQAPSLRYLKARDGTAFQLKGKPDDLKRPASNKEPVRNKTWYDPTPEDLRSLRKWIEAIPYLPHNLEDQEFATYFRCFKGSLEKTKSFIDKFYYGRIKYPEIMTNYDPLSPGAQLDMKFTYKVPLPKRAKDGSLIIVTKIRDPDAEYEPFEDFKMYTLIFKILVTENQLKSGKVVFIADCKDVKLSHLKKTTPNVIMTVISILTTIFPYRISAMHAINLPPAAEWMVTLVKSLIKSKLAERIFLHKNFEELFEWYSKEILPGDFGGEEESLDALHERFKKKLENYRPKLLEEEIELKKLDAVRPPAVEEDILVGSFRKLEVD